MLFRFFSRNSLLTITRQGWRTAELRAPQLARCVDLGEPHPALQGENKRDCIRWFVRLSQGILQGSDTAAAFICDYHGVGPSPAAAHSVVYHHYKYAKGICCAALGCMRERQDSAPYCKFEDTGATCFGVDGMEGWRDCLRRIPSFTRPCE